MTQGRTRLPLALDNWDRVWGDQLIRAIDQNFEAPVNSADVTFLQSGAGAVTRTVQSKERDVVSVKDFGAVGNGVANDTSAFQAAATSAVSRGVDLYVPPGTYSITSTIIFDQTSKTTFANGRTNLIGSGKGSTRISYSGSAGTAALSFVGPTWSSTNVPYVRQRVSGVMVDCLDPSVTRTGILVNRAIDLVWDDIEVIQAYQAVDAVDVVHWSLNNCTFTFNNYGILGRRSPSFGVSNNGSPVNIVLMNKCEFTNNRQWAVDFFDSANIVVVGGSFESNGRTSPYYSSDANRWSIRIRAPDYNGAAGLMMYGVHFETNGGDADVWIDQTVYPGVFEITGCDFVRNGYDFGQGVSFTINNILFNSTGAAASRLRVCAGFRGVNGYTPSAARKYIAGTLVGSVHSMDDEGCIYESSIEQPVFGLRGHRYGSHVHGSATWGWTGSAVSIFASYNIFTITRSLVGRYVITWGTPTTSSVYSVTQSPGTDQLTMVIVGRTAAAATVEFRNLLGVPTDPTFEIGIVAFAS